MKYCSVVFFFNDPATTEIYTYRHTLSLHEAVPIFRLTWIARGEGRRQIHERQRADSASEGRDGFAAADAQLGRGGARAAGDWKSTVCTPVTNAHLVCRLLLEKKNTTSPGAQSPKM